MPSTPTRKQLARDERIEIISQLKDGNTLLQIARNIGRTATSRKGRGRHPKLSEDRLTGVIGWIRTGFDNRCKSVDQIVAELNLSVCRETLQRRSRLGA
ncbi:transposable element tc1 transposase [Penicillium bovifimosum]|uniref:Transposable element tc1 transposase n=1 Tax=Penicillium bovifimosum TaxID=126998 RepID=A0A9W9H9I5_9EURO|nr:transposable element tc1 transposase [Penicillium bovifimosum]KAJ5142535.1 transposable element tc1 transposase [Penicillium bovifimosum]